MYRPILIPLIQHTPNIVHENKNRPLILTELKKQPKPKNQPPPQPKHGTRHHKPTHPHKTKQQKSNNKKTDSKPALFDLLLHKGRGSVQSKRPKEALFSFELLAE